MKVKGLLMRIVHPDQMRSRTSTARIGTFLVRPSRLDRALVFCLWKRYHELKVGAVRDSGEPRRLSRARRRFGPDCIAGSNS
jgi:hypothetical protein